MPSLLIIDDDELSREVLELLALQAGYTCTTAESGPAALEHLTALSTPTQIALTDMQMPGITGQSLARLLRLACGPAAILLAMSGSQPPADSLQGFDGFLLKPFTMEDLSAAVAGISRTPHQPTEVVVLNQAIYAGFAASMPAAQVHALYTMCVDDADKRLATLEAAADARDADAYTRAAHAIKGGCGMVGATELAALAGAMETNGLPEVGNKAPFAEFMAASARLRRMLNAQSL